MARYEYRCRACGATFEQTRPMAEANEPTACPAGHTDTVKLFSALRGRRLLRRRLLLLSPRPADRS
jgi:putative FmdB family regulatory protein